MPLRRWLGRRLGVLRELEVVSGFLAGDLVVLIFGLGVRRDIHDGSAYLAHRRFERRRLERLE